MELYVGLDLHSRNTYIGIMDKAFNRVLKKRVPNHLEHILQTLAPFRNLFHPFKRIGILDPDLTAGICSAEITFFSGVNL